MLTMVLGGLWHGASWNFVIWGALHGGALAVNRAWQRRDGKTFTTPRILAIVVTFHFVCFAWIFFRSPTFAHATAVLARMGKLSTTTPNLSGRVLAVLALGFVTHFLPKDTFKRTQAFFGQSPALVQGIVLAACAYALHFAAGAKAEPFIYGQF